MLEQYYVETYGEGKRRTAPLEKTVTIKDDKGRYFVYEAYSPAEAEKIARWWFDVDRFGSNYYLIRETEYFFTVLQVKQ